MVRGGLWVHSDVGLTWFLKIADEMEYLSSILRQFEDPMKRIYNWRNQGQILMDYITLTDKVRII